MLTNGPAKKVTIYVNEDARYHHDSLYESILYFLLRKGVAGATASRAMAGFGAHHVMHTPNIEVLAERLPIIRLIHSHSLAEVTMPIGQPAKLIRIHCSKSDHYEGKRLYEAIVERCRQMKIAGATVFRGWRASARRLRSMGRICLLTISPLSSLLWTRPKICGPLFQQSRR